MTTLAVLTVLAAVWVWTLVRISDRPVPKPESKPRPETLVKIYLIYLIVTLAPLAFAEPKEKISRPLVYPATCAHIYRLASWSPAALIDPVSDEATLRYCIDAYHWKPGQKELLQRVDQNIQSYIHHQHLDRTAVVREQ